MEEAVRLPLGGDEPSMGGPADVPQVQASEDAVPVGTVALALPELGHQGGRVRVDHLLQLGQAAGGDLRSARVESEARSPAEDAFDPGSHQRRIPVVLRRAVLFESPRRMEAFVQAAAKEGFGQMIPP